MWAKCCPLYVAAGYLATVMLCLLSSLPFSYFALVLKHAAGFLVVVFCFYKKCENVMLMCGFYVLLGKKKKKNGSQQGPLTIMLMHHLCADAKWWCSNTSGSPFALYPISRALFMVLSVQ